MSKDEASGGSPARVAGGGAPAPKPSLLTMVIEIFGVSRAITLTALLLVGLRFGHLLAGVNPSAGPASWLPGPNGATRGRKWKD